MTGVKLSKGETLLAASRGVDAFHGLYSWTGHGEPGRGTLLASVAELAALVGHPKLPIIYGVSGTTGECQVHAWEVGDARAERIGVTPSGGFSPCHVAIDPAGDRLIVTNYRTSALAVQLLTGDGRFANEIELVTLNGDGSGIEPDRQDAAHPHQSLWVDNTLVVVDLGADLVREFAINPDDPRSCALKPIRETPVPAGTGPRHGVVLPDGRLALSGELASTLAVGRLGTTADDWAVCRSTARSGPAKTRSERNYPGDIQGSADGRYAYLANRGYDTISTFDVRGPHPALVSERYSGVAWPQHLLVHDAHLLIAGWDSSQVTAMPLEEGVPGAAQPVFACSGAAWLLMFREGDSARR